MFVLQVQADQYVSAADLRVETRQVTKQLEALEERGVDLERNIRECSNGSSRLFVSKQICVRLKTSEANTLVSFFISDKEEEGLLAEWLALTQERQILMRRDTELVYL